MPHFHHGLPCAVATGVLTVAVAGCRVVMLNVEDVIAYQEPAIQTAQPDEVSDPGLSRNAFFARTLAGNSADSLARPNSEARLTRSDYDVREKVSTGVRLCAYLEHRSALFTVGCIKGVLVEFRRDGRLLGTANTDERGRACFFCDAGAETWRYTARVALPGGECESEGGVFVWSIERPAIVIDLDETLLQSRYIDMVLWLDDRSRPMSRAREVVTRLARRYGIIYISARARVFRDMTQTWLREHDFPPGPIVHADDLSAVFEQREAKFDMVQMLKQRGVHVVAGIGDKAADELAFDDADILTIIVNPWYSARRTDTIVLDDWSNVLDVVHRRAPAETPSTRATASIPQKAVVTN